MPYHSYQHLNNVHKLQDELVKQANVSLKHILDEIDNGAKLNEKFKEEIAKLANDIVKTFNSGI